VNCKSTYLSIHSYHNNEADSLTFEQPFHQKQLFNINSIFLFVFEMSFLNYPQQILYSNPLNSKSCQVLSIIVHSICLFLLFSLLPTTHTWNTATALTVSCKWRTSRIPAPATIVAVKRQGNANSRPDSRCMTDALISPAINKQQPRGASYNEFHIIYRLQYNDILW